MYVQNLQVEHERLHVSPHRRSTLVLLDFFSRGVRTGGYHYVGRVTRSTRLPFDEFLNQLRRIDHRLLSPSRPPFFC